jgi:hypothetical protein
VADVVSPFGTVVVGERAGVPGHGFWSSRSSGIVHAGLA